MQKIKVLSLFDGVSIAQQAFKELGFEVEYYASEIDKYAIQITQKNFPDTIQIGKVEGIRCKDDELFVRFGESPHGDVPSLRELLYKPFDLLIGGFPCTNLSIAKNNREGLAGAQSGLFYEMTRIHKEVKPKYFIYENVFSMAKDQKEIITQTIGELMQCPCGCGEWGSLDRCND